MNIAYGISLIVLGGASYFVGMQTARATRGMVGFTAAGTTMLLGILLIAAGPLVITS